MNVGYFAIIFFKAGLAINLEGLVLMGQKQ